MLQATYHWPIQSHASMGPSCAVADIRDGSGTIWTASQNTHRSRRTFARLLGLDPARLRLIYLDGSGSYGSYGNDDAAFEAALISREIDHAPFRFRSAFIGKRMSGFLQCAPRARFTSGGRFHPESCRLLW
jgi:CO/xanthine dehydrogenase Mo-binding subunit